MNQPPRVSESELLSEGDRINKIVQNFTHMQLTAEALGISEIIQSAVMTGKTYLDVHDGAADFRAEDQWYVFITIGQKAIDDYAKGVEDLHKQLNDTLYNFAGMVLCDYNHPEQPFQKAPPSRLHRKALFQRAPRQD